MQTIDYMSLDTFNLSYEELPTKKRILKMDKLTNNSEVKQAKTRRVYEKTRGEHTKDIIIAVLITAVIAFCVGVKYQNNIQADMQKAVAAATVQPTKK